MRTLVILLVEIGLFVAIGALLLVMTSPTPVETYGLKWERIGKYVDRACDHGNLVYVIRNSNIAGDRLEVIEGGCR